MALSNMRNNEKKYLTFTAEKEIRGRKFQLDSNNPLFLYAFLDMKEKVEEGLEKGFGEDCTNWSMEMATEKVKEYAEHPGIQYDRNKETEDVLFIRDSGTIYLGKVEGLALESKSITYENLDLMQAAIIGESKNVLVWGMEHHMLLDCGMDDIRKIVCLCRNKEILSAIMEKECTSYYIEPEDALDFVNPVLLQLIYEDGEKSLEEDIYDKCIDAYIEEYYCRVRMPMKESRLTSIGKIMTMDYGETRIEREFIMDFISCMKYLRKQGYKSRRKRISGKKKKKLTCVLKYMEGYLEHPLYEEFLELIQL